MHSFIDRFSYYCIERKLITPSDYAWFKYGLEKRIYTVVVAIPFFFLAVYLTNIYTALAFYSSFYCLRRRVGGFHAGSVWMCFVWSLLFEFIFLGMLNPLLNMVETLLLSAVSLVVVFILAPYNHPKMNLSAEEIVACRISSRKYSCGIVLGVLVFSVLDAAIIAKGFSLGLAMAACLLCLAYIVNGGKH